MTRPQIGEWLMIRAKAHKGYEKVHSESILSRTMWEHALLDEPIKAMYIGWRTVFDGDYMDSFTMTSHSDYGTEYDVIPPYFAQTNKHEVWLFIRSDRTNPIYVFPKDVEWNENQKEG